MGTTVTTIRPMDVSDIDAAAAMELDSRPRPWTVGVFRDELAADDRVYLVAEADDGVIGFGGVMLVGDEAHVTNLHVNETSRRRGIGRELMVSLVESAADRGARHLTLEVRVSNEAARSLYAAFGMVPVGVRPKYYGDEDALILWVHDIDRPDYLEGLR